MQFGPGSVKEDEFLTRDECARLVEKVCALQQHWEPRFGPYGFSTLGCAAYLDYGDGTYTPKSRSLNPMMLEAFGEVYERVRQYFNGILDAEAYYDESYSYPGFHLFEFQGDEGEGDNPADRAHFDLQFTQAFPDFEKQALAMPLTFTLPLEEPSSGSSLEMWDVRPQDKDKLELGQAEYARNNPSKTVHYAIGRMVTHDGLNLHAIGRITPGAVGRRITLQGHAFKTPKGWLLYW